jgi:hypothetical protein
MVEHLRIHRRLVLQSGYTLVTNSDVTVGGGLPRTRHRLAAVHGPGHRSW